MLKCPKCGTVGLNQSGECGLCGFGRGDNADTSKEVASIVPVRPDGTTPIMLGAALVGFGIVLGLLSIAAEGPDSLTAHFALIDGSAGCFSLGLVLWLAGYIVKAIWFLPAREDVGAK